MKFVDDTVVIGLSANKMETAYLKVLELLNKTNHLDLNVTKTKEIEVDFMREKQRSNYAPLKTYVTLVEKMSSYRFLGVHISEDLTWTTHIISLMKKAG